MNAPLPIPQAVLGDIDDFSEACSYTAWFYGCGWIDLQTPVDNMHNLSALWGLIDFYGQDLVQALMAGEFAPYRDAIQPEPEQISLTEYDRREMQRRVERWEAADRERPAPPQGSGPTAYRTPQSTIDAFWSVLQQGDAERLDRWLADHSRDASHLNEIWRAKCSTVAA